MFPEERYDYGVREAVGAILEVASAGAVLVSDVPGVVAFYADRGGRRDLRVRALSSDGIPAGAPDVFVIVQDEHLTFENRTIVAALRRTMRPWRLVYATHACSAEVFRISRHRARPALLKG
jgi:hypothetical protein